MNLKDINAFALPGGPMFVQRGMFDAAAEEAEVAGVIAHALSRVLLRHATANASRAQNPWRRLGQIAGAGRRLRPGKPAARALLLPCANDARIGGVEHEVADLFGRAAMKPD